MRIQGSNEEEGGEVQINKKGTGKQIQEVYQNLKNYFSAERSYDLFEVLSAVRSEGWEVRCLLHYKEEIRIVTVKIEENIESIREELRCPKK